MLEVQTGNMTFRISVSRGYSPRTRKYRRKLRSLRTANPPADSSAIEAVERKMRGDNPNITTKVQIFEVDRVQERFLGEGISTKGPSDDYHPWIGKKIALTRALKNASCVVFITDEMSRTIWNAFRKRFEIQSPMDSFTATAKQIEGLKKEILGEGIHKE